MVRTGMTRAFGAGLRRLVAVSTRNRLAAFGVGVGVTALLQSSTATALIVASFAGGFIPIFLERMHVDPAVASSVFVTTLTDLWGFLLLLGLASRFLLG